MLLFDIATLYALTRTATAAERAGAPDELRGTGAEPIKPADTPPRRCALLIVDDELLVARGIARQLRAHDVTVATSGREALALLAAGQRFDAILCDLMMPELTGMDLHDVLRERFPDALRGLLFITCGGFTPRSQEFLERVKRPYLRKPFDARQLRAALASIGVET